VTAVAVRHVAVEVAIGGVQEAEGALRHQDAGCESTVRISTVPDAVDGGDHARPRIQLVDDTMVAHSEPIEVIFSGQLKGLARKWVFGKFRNGRDNAGNVARGVPAKLALRGGVILDF
jgi:hypothetical protein